MYVARLFILVLLILALVFTYSPFLLRGISQAWDVAQPGVIQFMDGLYAAIRNFVAGADIQDGIHDDAPGVNFDIIITMQRGVLV